MKKIIPVTLTLLLLFFASTAIAHRGIGQGNLNGYTSQGDRIDQRLDIRGDRIKGHFDHKTARAIEQGKYRLAHKFQKKGDQINHHLDRISDRLHARFDQFWNTHPVRQHNGRTYKRSAAPVQGHLYRDHYNSHRR